MTQICAEACDWKNCQLDCPRVRMWSGLLKAGKDIHSLDRRKILAFALSRLNDVLELSGCATRILEEGEVAVYGLREEDLRNGVPQIDEKVISQETPVVLDSGLFYVAATPITFKNKVLGVLYAYSRTKEFPKEALQMIKTVAECVGVALENEKRYRTAMKNWHEAIEELWSKIDVWGTPGKLQDRK